MIQRDGQNISLWQDSALPYEAKNIPDGSPVYDVIIVGGGITGISTALLLQAAGKNCLLIEAAGLCFGTTGGTTAYLNTLLDTPYTTISKNFGKENARLVATAAREAIQLIRNNISQYNIECEFEEADAYLFAQDEDQDEELESIMEATNDAGVQAGYSDNIPVSIPFTKALKAGGQAKFNPVKYVFALANAFEKAGGFIIQQCRVTGVENNEVVEVETSEGIFKAKDLVYATHIPPGVNLIHLRCVPYRSYAMAVTLKDDNYPEDLAYDMYDPYHYYRTQKINDRNYFIAGGYDHKTAHEQNTEHCFLQLEGQVRKYFKVKSVDYRWSSQYFESADGLPYIGHLPGSPEHIYVATGYGGNGMVYSSVAALTLKEILLDEEKKYGDLFNPNRIKPIAGFTNFIKHNADVVKEFVGKLFSHEKLAVLAELAPGEAKVVNYEGRKVALYKTESGSLHAVNPVCTHFKCEVRWNTTEKSWDCPCHGARYSFDGKVLTGPADRDLEYVPIETLVENKK